MLSERQQDILEKIVREYVETAEPVSSQQLEERYALAVGGATIRRDFVHLTDAGYIAQPHTSAGRVPTDKGYRFVVDRLVQQQHEQAPAKRIADAIEELVGESLDGVHLVRGLSRIMADTSSLLAFSYLPEEDVWAQEGFADVMREPEFNDPACCRSFAELLDEMHAYLARQMDVGDSVQVLIGGENSLPSARAFSIVMVRSTFPGDRAGIVALAGPRRMHYPKSIRLVSSVADILEG